MHDTTHEPDPNEPLVHQPGVGDVDSHAEEIMHQGKPDRDNDDLQDPWFNTQPGQAWLHDLGEL